MKVRAYAAGLIFSAFLVAAACQGSNALDDESSTTRAEANYLATLSSAYEDAREAYEDVALTLGPLFPNYAFSSLQEAVVYSELQQQRARVDETLAALSVHLQEQQPPERFRSDHDLLIEWLGRRASINNEMNAALGNRDILGYTLARSRAQEVDMRTFSRLSHEFCVNTIGEERTCVGGTALPGGEYGKNLHQIVVDWQLVFTPRASFFPAWLPDDVVLEGLSMVQPEIIQVFVETIDALQSLDPPSEYKSGHEIVVQYFESLLEVSRDIDIAVDARDIEAVRDLFERSGIVTRSINQNLPENIRPIVSVVFGSTAPR